MKFLGTSKSKSRFRNIAITVIVGWVFLMAVSYVLQTYSLNRIREYEVENMTLQYEYIFDTALISGYFAQNEGQISQEDFVLFAESIVENKTSIESITIAKAGIVEFAYPQDKYEDSNFGYGYDIMSHLGVTDVNQLLTSFVDRTTIYQYEKNDDDSLITRINIRRPIHNNSNGELYGFVTISIDSTVFESADFRYQSSSVASALFTQDGTKISGDGTIDDYNIHDITMDTVTLQAGQKLQSQFLFAFRSYSVGFVLAVSLIYVVILILVFRDKHSLVELETELDFRQNYDPETNLFNVDRLYLDIQQLIDDKKEFYLAFLNINNVKYINEKFGHKTTGELLKKTTQMIVRVLRQNSILYRYGGDEYVIVTSTDSISEEKNLMRRVINIFEGDIVSDNIRVRLGVQIGITKYPNNGFSVEELIKNAHLTASHVSNYDKEGFLFYRQDRIADTLLDEDFDKMVSNLDLELFEVYMMPIVDVNTNLIQGFECLSRVFNDLGKKLNTEDVVLSLERNGKIQILDEIVFRKMLLLMKKLNKAIPEEEYFISLNASALSLNDEYVNNVISAYKAARFKKGQIVLELTESYQVEDYDYLIKLFRKLNENGIKIAIDDFGSGYSSLSYISKFPIYAIKVDKEYVRDYRDNDFNKTLLMTLKSIAEVLECKLVAEGVDSPETLEFLQEFGCPFYQGYLFSQGLPFDDAIALVKNNLLKYKKIEAKGEANEE